MSTDSQQANEPNSPGSAIDAAMAQWQQLLGGEFALRDHDTIQRFEQTTLPRGTRPSAVLRPESVEQVQEIVRIANRFQVPLYPISRGKNWGYGDACAPTNHQVILDMSRMNKIREVNDDLAYAVVEPGVSQGQLSDRLRREGRPMWLDVTGAGPDASVIGNTIERGFGHTPYGNHFTHISGMEVVLPTGECIRTGYGAFPNAKADRVFPLGIGPYIDGLFTQSNLGIVTSMAVWLLRIPECCRGFAFVIHRAEDLGNVVDALRELRLLNVINSTVHIANDLRALSSRRQYPWDLTDNKTPLPPDIRQQLRREASFGAWNVIGGLYGTRRSVSAAQKAVKKSLRRWVRVVFFDDKKLDRAEMLLKCLPPLRVGRQFSKSIDSVRSVFELLKGIPSSEHLKGTGWRSRVPPDDPAFEITKCGLLWFSPVLPMTREACEDVLGLVEPIFAKYSFEALITLISITPRALCGVISIAYDREVPGEGERAGDCYHELFQTLATHGYLPYRAGSQSMAQLASLGPVTTAPLAAIKKSLDPNGILAPGRYDFSYDWGSASE